MEPDVPADRRREDRRAGDEGDRRRGDRRHGQAAVLHHRRATDRRLGADEVDVVLQQRAFARQVAQPRSSGPVVDLVQRVVDLREPERAPVVELARCPLCEVLVDPLWLFRHVAVEH